MTNAAAPAAPLRLEYQPVADAPAAQQARRRWRVASCAAMLPGLVVPFVPFACDHKPAVVAVCAPMEWMLGEPIWDSMALWLASLPLLLPIPIVAWKLREVTRAASVSRRERAAGLAVGGVGATAVAALIGVLWHTSSDLSGKELAALSILAGTLLLAAALFARLTVRGRGRDAENRVSVALLGPYLAGAAFCLFLWAGDAQAGWYLTLLPAAAALLELAGIALVAVRPAPGAARHAASGDRPVCARPAPR